MKVIKPILFNRLGQPKDPELLKQAQDYFYDCFSKPLPDVSKFYIVWAVVKDGKVIGVAGIQGSTDITLFHSEDPKVYSMLFRRAHTYCADSGIETALVRVTESEAENMKSMLEKSKAVSANRWVFTVNHGGD